MKRLKPQKGTDVQGIWRALVAHDCFKNSNWLSGQLHHLLCGTGLSSNDHVCLGNVPKWQLPRMLKGNEKGVWV